MSSVREIVEHYQKSIEKTREKKRLLHCIEKLYKLPITLEHLEETGIGKTVNNLRKEEGEVKVAARALVAKWKAMVAQAEIERNAAAEETPRRDSSSDHEQESQEDNDDVSPQVVSSHVEKEKSEGSSSSSKKEHHSRDSSKSHKRRHHHREKSHSDSHSHTSNHKKEKRDRDREKHREKRDSEHRSKKELSESQRKVEKESREKPKKIKPQIPSKSQSEDGDSDGSIDNSKGASFADVLSMISDVPHRKSGQKRHKPTETPATSTSTSSRADAELTPKKKKSEVKVAVVRPLGPPDMLKSPDKLVPLDPEIIKSETLEIPQITMPQITNNYRPMPLNPAVMECVFPTASGSGCSKQKPSTATFHMMTDEEAMGTSMQSKNLRTKVYSGVKTGALMQVPTLHELCIRILQKNIDALEYTGGVPFEILKPVIERASAQQLFTFEHYNPYLMEDTDGLWQQHCKRRFKSEKRQEMESWREMYLRCQDEQEARFNSLTQNIKQSLTTSVPVRKTQLAYVDSIVKPPRSVQRKQNQFGTRGKVSATPAARVAALSGISRNIAKAGDSRLKVATANREYDPASSTSAVKPKRAPLMQKSLMLFKGRLKK